MAELEEPVSWYQSSKARIAADVDDVAELESRGYAVVPTRDLPQGVPVGEAFDRTVSDADQPVEVPLDPILEPPVQPQ